MEGRGCKGSPPTDACAVAHDKTNSTERNIAARIAFLYRVWNKEKDKGKGRRDWVGRVRLKRRKRRRERRVRMGERGRERGREGEKTSERRARSDWGRSSFELFGRFSRFTRFISSVTFVSFFLTELQVTFSLFSLFFFS